MTAALLGGVNVATVRRLEEDGYLKPIRLSRKPTGQVFYTAKQVHELVTTAAADD